MARRWNSVALYLEDLKKNADQKGIPHRAASLQRNIPQIRPSAFRKVQKIAMAKKRIEVVGGWYDCIHEIHCQLCIGAHTEPFVLELK